jgi:hypothetical protein
MINTSQQTHANNRAAPPALWAIAQACLRTLNALFGAPRDVAAAGWLSRRAHKLLRAWLNAAHAVIARLILIEAAALPALQRKGAPARHRKPRARRLIEHHADRPETWRVSLRLVQRRRPRRRTPSASATTTSRDPQQAWPLAERYEALLRACANPAPYAQRLARHLHAAPHRAAAIAGAVHSDLINSDACAALAQAATRAADSFSARIRAPPTGGAP